MDKQIEQVQTIKSQIDFLVSVVHKYNDIDKMILFGSSARDNNESANDIDVLILVKHEGVDLDSLISSIRRETFLMMTVPVDMIVETLSTFEARKYLPTLERTIYREGVVVYAA